MSADDAAKKAKPKAKKPADHPKYSEMITAAIGALKERTGSSRQALLKYIVANNKVGDNAAVHLKIALKRGVASGALTQVKGTGASGSFKVAKVEKPKNPKAKEPVAKKKPAKKTPAKAKPKQKTKKVTGEKLKAKNKKKVATKEKKSKAKTTKKPTGKKTATKQGKKSPTKKKATPKKPAAKGKK